MRGQAGNLPAQAASRGSTGRQCWRQQVDQGKVTQQRHAALHNRKSILTCRFNRGRPIGAPSGQYSLLCLQVMPWSGWPNKLTLYTEYQHRGCMRRDRAQTRMHTCDSTKSSSLRNLSLRQARLTIMMIAKSRPHSHPSLNKKAGSASARACTPAITLHTSADPL